MRNYSDFIPTTVGNDTLPARTFLDLFSDLDDKTKLWDVDDETFTVPSDGLWNLEFCVAGNPTDPSVLTVSSGAGGTGTVYQVTLGPPTANQVQAIPFKGKLRFGTSIRGLTVYANYKTTHSSVTIADIARLWNRVVQLQSVVAGVTYQVPAIGTTAGEYLSDQFVYLGEDGRAYASSPNDYTKLPIGYVRGAHTLNSAVDVEVMGVTEEYNLSSEIPKGVEIVAGYGGLPTWYGDTDLYRSRKQGDKKKTIGYSVDGLTVLFNCLVPVTQILGE